MVPGHEIVGVVAEIGPSVAGFKVGDRVGIGNLVDSCGSCENCLAGEEPFCLKGNVHAYNAIGYDGEPTYGGYSTRIVVGEKFVLRIPDGLSSAEAAPLLCCDITTYVPLRRWGAGPGRRVAVIGMGGLGHMAVKLAHAPGAEVTVLSRHLDKRDDAIALGADQVLATTGRPSWRSTCALPNPLGTHRDDAGTARAGAGQVRLDPGSRGRSPHGPRHSASAGGTRGPGPGWSRSTWCCGSGCPIPRPIWTR